MESVVSGDGMHHAAILLRGGRQDCEVGSDDYLQRDTFAPFDIWQYCQDFGQIMQAPADRLVVGSDLQNVEAALGLKYPNGLSILLFGNHDVAVNYQEHSWSRRRRFGYDRIRGWRVMSRPIVTKADWETEEQLQNLSIESDGLWVDRESFCRLGYEHSVRAKGFVVRETVGGGQVGDWTLLRYNPRNLELKTWRKEKDRIEELLKGEYPEGLLTEIGQALSPANWPFKHRFSNAVVWNGSATCHSMLRLIELGQQMVPRRAYWRTHTCYFEHRGGQRSYKDSLDQLLIYSHGVIKKAKGVLANREACATDRRAAREAITFTHWLKQEAKALRLKMPACPVVPPMPPNPIAAGRKRRKTLRSITPSESPE